MTPQNRRTFLAAMGALAGSLAGTPAAATRATPATWSSAAPRIPDIALQDHQGNAVDLRALLLQGPVAVNFFYTGCSSFCPPQTAIFRQLQGLLRTDPLARAQLISLSIDPLGDSPRAVAQFAERYDARIGAGTGWWMLTGHAKRARELESVLRAFDVHAASLAEHPAQTWIGNAPASRWMRTTGLASAQELHQWLRSAAA